MRHARVRPIVAAAVALLAVCAAVRAEPEDNPRTSNTVHVTVVVTDRRDVVETSLKPGDFQLLDEGVPQTIESVDAPGAVAPARDIALVLDEYHVRAADTARVRQTLTRFVDEDVRPNDVVIVLRPLESLLAIRPVRDRDEMHRAIAEFQGRMGDYTPRTPFESTYMGTDPATVEAIRSQIVLSMLNALTTAVGDRPETRKAILLVSDGFVPRYSTRRDGGLPDIRAVVRSASIFNVGLSSVSPGADANPDVAEADATTLRALTDGAAGTWFAPAQELFGSLHRVAHELDSSYTLTYRARLEDVGRFHKIEVRVKGDASHVRARGGYALEGADQARLAALHPPPIDALPSRLQHQSKLIKPFFGMTRAEDGRTRVTFTWEPAVVSGSKAPRAATIIITAKTDAGDQLFSGSVSAVGLTGAPSAVLPERVAFDAPPGTIQLDMRIEGGDEKVLDNDVRDIKVANLAGNATVMSAPEVLRTRTARQWTAVLGDADAPPVASREFSRTERLLIRVPAYGPGQSDATVTATLESGMGQPMRALPVIAGSTPGVTQFDLLLAPYAPGDYTIALKATSAAGQALENFTITITD